MKQNLCIDIDGTLTDAYYWLDLANKYFGKNIKHFEVTSYDIHKVLDIPRQEYERFYELYGEQIHEEAQPREDVNKVLWRLSHKYNIYYVTAREEKMEEVTNRWLVKHNLPKGELYLLGSNYKVDKARELNCHIFIEDRYENAIQLGGAGFKVLLMDCYYNRKSLIPGITRVFDWREIYEKIEQHHTVVNHKSTKIA